jgi:hypothetical protein
MKKSIFNIFIVFFLSLVICNGNALAGKVLVDTFSSGYLDDARWWPREYVHEVANGQYTSKLGNSIGMGAEVIPGIFQVELPFADPGEINAIQAEITLVEAIPDKQDLESESCAIIGGFFYSINEIEELAGDIYAEIYIGNRGNGLEAFWEVNKRMTNDSLQWELLGEGTIILDSPMQFNVPVTVKLSYDGNKTFVFSVNGKTNNFTGTIEKKRGPQESFKALLVGIEAFDGSNSGFISAKFDNVYINNFQTIYDNFSGSTINLTKWSYTEWVREVANGRLQSVLKRSNSNGQVSTYLSTKEAPYLEAKVRIDSDTQLSEGASCIARLQGYFYNDSKGPGSGNEYNIYEGDIFAQIRLEYRSDGTLNAQAYINRSDTADESAFPNLFSHTFGTPISLDTDYILSINFEGNKLLFSCDDETTVYTITTPIYPPYGEHRGLRSRLYLDPGETGYLKTQFDDVYIIYPYLKGDINRDSKINLEDSVSGLKVMTSYPNSANLSADTNSDYKIDIIESVYVLQDIAELRNKPPVLNPIGNKSVDEESRLSFTISAVSPDGLALNFSVFDIPDGAIFDSEMGEFSWTPTSSQNGHYTITFSVTDQNNKSDSETITITINDNAPIFDAADYFPLIVGDWREYKRDITGTIDRTTVSGTKLINGLNAFIFSYQISSGMEYYTSQSPGLQFYGQYDSSASAIEIIFDVPLMLWPDNAQIGEQYIAETTTSYIIRDKQYHVVYKSTSTLIGLENVVILNTVFNDCVKAFLEVTATDQETGQTLTMSRTIWFYKGLGVVKDTRSDGATWRISGSYINGVHKTY